MSITRLFTQLVNKNGTPVEVSDENRLLAEVSGAGGGALATEATLLAANAILGTLGTESTLISVLKAIVASDKDS